jgi:hypothetical protein
LCYYGWQAKVEQVLFNKLKVSQRKTRRLLWQQGAKDKLLLKDITDIETAFMTADAETAELTAN